MEIGESGVGRGIAMYVAQIEGRGMNGTASGEEMNQEE